VELPPPQVRGGHCCIQDEIPRIVQAGGEGPGDKEHSRGRQKKTKDRALLNNNFGGASRDPVKPLVCHAENFSTLGTPKLLTFKSPVETLLVPFFELLTCPTLLGHPQRSCSFTPSQMALCPSALRRISGNARTPRLSVPGFVQGGLLLPTI